MNPAFRKFIPVFFLIAFLIWFDVYLYSGITAAIHGTSVFISDLFLGLYSLIQILTFIFMLLFLLRSRKPGGRSEALTRIYILVFMLVFIPALFFGIFLLGEDIYRILRMMLTALFHAFGQHSTESVWMLEPRSTIWSRAGLSASMLLWVSLLYAITRGKYRYKVHPVNVEFADLPEAFDGFTITQLSDIHAGSFDNKEEVRRAVELVNKQESDVIFFTGDLVNNSASEMEPWVEVFEATRAVHGKFSILGNHDYGDYRAWPSGKHKEDNLLALFHMHERIGFNLLRNENLKIEKDGESIELLGIENWGSGRFAKYGDLNKTLEGTKDGAFKILLSHDPSHWEEQVLDAAPHIHLTLSGHTHGMQFGFEFMGIRFSPIQFRYKRWAGLYEQDNRFLYVNRGFGFLGFPGRLGI
ncbi:MAG TPA: metallophosphoesterase, partial [Bacteroidia bacterium]|nr:metallophosphoesterase [Bacteroidia bacterium]